MRLVILQIAVYFLMTSISGVAGSSSSKGFVLQADTCAVCSSKTKRGTATTRFKACKLLTLQNTLKGCLKDVKMLEKEITKGFHFEFKHKKVDRSEFLEADEFINSTYTRLQSLFLLEQIAVRFNKEYHLDVPVGSLSYSIRHLLCQIEPVLRSGHFYEDVQFVDRCRVSFFIPYDGLQRKDGINFIINFVYESTYALKAAVSNVNRILKQI